jgi:hypothetical protein
MPNPHTRENSIDASAHSTRPFETPFIETAWSEEVQRTLAVRRYVRIAPLRRRTTGKDHRTRARSESSPTRRAIAGTRRNAFDRKRSCVSLAVGPVPGHRIVANALARIRYRRMTKGIATRRAIRLPEDTASQVGLDVSRRASRRRPSNVEWLGSIYG